MILKQLLFFYCFIILMGSSNAQVCIGLTKAECHKAVTDNNSRHSLMSFFEESQAKIVFRISRQLSLYNTITVTFNSQGICESQTNVFECDSCYYFAFQNLVKNSSFKWRKLDDKVFKSEKRGGLILDFPPNTFMTFRIRKPE